MKRYNVGVLGATGAVGQEMLNILKEQNFPINELKLFASSRSAGKVIEYNGKEYTILLAEKGAFKGLDFVLGAASNAVAIELADDIVQSGAVFIDNSSAFSYLGEKDSTLSPYDFERKENNADKEVKSLGETEFDFDDF